MPAWVLKLGALLATALSLVGSTDYVTHHAKNAAAPLRPPVQVAVVASHAPAAATPRPRITLQPGVRATQLPGITITHVS